MLMASICTMELSREQTINGLNPKQMCASILKPHHNIVSIVYCTAKVRPKATDPTVRKRQANYIKAIEIYIPEITVIYGHFLESKVLCRLVDSNLGSLVEVFRTEEKGSDVNLVLATYGS